MGPSTGGPHRTLDIQGAAGTKVRALASQALRSMLPGQVLRLITTERSAMNGIEELCREEGYALLDECMEGSRYSFLIRR